MDGLTFIAHCIFFTLGTIFGASLMYYVPIIIERINELGGKR